MSPAILAQVYREAVSKQSRAQIEFETAEPAHRAKSRVALLESTRAVVAAADRLQAALDPHAPIPPKGPSIRRPPAAATTRATTPAEEVLLRQLLSGDLLPRYKRSEHAVVAEERPRPARAPDGSFAVRVHPSAAEDDDADDTTTDD